MPNITVQLDTPIRRTFRVEQVAGMFDVPIGERLSHGLTAEVPGLDEPWTIGAIVGPSGSGKTTLARAAYGEAVCEPLQWPEDRAIIDCLGELSGVGVPRALQSDGRRDAYPTNSNGRRDAYPTIKQLARVLTAVGLGSVPTWLKPYRVLSTGERFRADLARAILGAGACLVFDEFTSTLDRTVARTLSAALARLVRLEPGTGDQEPIDGSTRFLAPGSRFLAPLRFVALSCHADILPWLAPDWVLELDGEAQPRLTWPAWSRPEVPLEIRRVPQSLWARFARHHFLAGGLAASATCYAAFVEGARDWGLGTGRSNLQNRERLEEALPLSPQSPAPSPSDLPIAFCAVVATLGWRKTKRITRLVTLPEFQGLGIASRLAAAAAELEARRGNRVTITASHPAIVAHCSRSPAWLLIGVKKTGSTRQSYGGRAIRSSAGRAVASFEFVPGCN